MHAQKDATASIDCENSGDKITSTEVLIIGFGLSAIPLIRELERDGINYAIVSNGESIWDKLEKHERLDFDLVSSMHTSVYSFELVNRDTKDRYPTSKDFLSFVRKYLTQYSSKVMKDWVTLVENHSSNSIVHTQGGRIFATKHLVISTAFKRRMNQLLNEFDYASARSKTIAMTAMGDSVNLMISKLIPYNNRIVLITNGFILLDKLSLYDGTSYTLDQLEYHNIRHLSNLLYRKTISTGLECVLLCQKLARLLSIDKLLSIDNVYFKHPLAIRSFKVNFKNFLSQSPLPNGIIAIKYWPIDTYQALFDNGSLKQSIRDGYLLNDIAFFLEQGLVELWPKQETVIDRERCTIRWKDNVIKYDHIVDADYEVPNLPAIVVDREGAPKRNYEYVCRSNFMGIVPKELSNVYFIGFIRPTTGGLNNITEMQCLFTHKMIADPGFNQEIYENIEERIRRYNKHYHPSDAKSHTDHLTHYGFYTDDVARLIKINPRFSDCRSMRDLAIHFIFPNSAFKYRQSGPYKVEGVKEMVQQIYKDHKGFSIVTNYLLTYALLQLTAYVALFLTYYRQPIYLPAVALPFLFIIVLLNPFTAFVAANGFGRNSYVNIALVGALGLTAYYQDPLIPIASLLVAFALTYAFRRFGWARVPFNDLRNKKSRKYQEFFKRYRDAFKEVFSEIDAPIRRRSAGRGTASEPSDQVSPGATSSAVVIDHHDRS
jgi:hypothetical protein